MSVTITPLTMDGFESLPVHGRRCVFWEMEPDLIPDMVGGEPFESEFDKEAWVSMLLLEWARVHRLRSIARPAKLSGPRSTVPRAVSPARPSSPLPRYLPTR